MKEITKIFLFWECFLSLFKGFAADFAELELFEKVDAYLRNPKKNETKFLEYTEMYFGMRKPELRRAEKLYQKELKRMEKHF
jgi:hypothetical protein